MWLQDLQAHNDNLQEYLKIWCKKQEYIIKIAHTASETLPPTDRDNAPALARKDEPGHREFLERLQGAHACLLDLAAFQRSSSTVAANEKQWVAEARFHLESVLSPSGDLQAANDFMQQIAAQSSSLEVPPEQPFPVQSHSGAVEVSLGILNDASAQASLGSANSVAAQASQQCDTVNSTAAKSSLRRSDTFNSEYQAAQPALGSHHSIGVEAVRDISSTIPIASRRQSYYRTSSAINVLLDKHDEKHNTRASSEKPLLLRMASSYKFDALCAAVVSVNAATIGFSASYNMANLDGPELVHLNNLEIAFIFFYTFEVFLRGYVFRWKYFCGEDYRWNWFDILLVAVSLFENLRNILPAGSLGMTLLGNVSFMRAFRLLKMIRLFRVVRLMKAFKELRLILTSITGGLKTMLWAILLVSLIQYIAGVCFLQGVTQLLQDNPGVRKSTQEAIDEYWCTIARSMNSLFAACTGGADWYLMADPLYEAGWVYYALFILYIGFCILVVLNTLTSIFLQATIEHSEHDHELLIQREMQHKENYIGTVKAFFDEIDEDGSGDVSLEEFRKHVGNPTLRAFAEGMDIPVEDAEQFFRVLSNNGAVNVDIDTFVMGCIKLRGQAKSVDLFGMYQMVKSVHRKIGILQKQVSKLEIEHGHAVSKSEGMLGISEGAASNSGVSAFSALHHELAVGGNGLGEQIVLGSKSKL